MKKLFTLFLVMTIIFSFAIAVRAEVIVTVSEPLDSPSLGDVPGMVVYAAPDLRREVIICFDEDITDMPTPYAGIWATNVEKIWGPYITVNGIKIFDTKTSDGFTIHYDGGKDNVKGLRVYSINGKPGAFDETKANTIILDKNLPLLDGTLGKTVTMTYDPATKSWTDTSPVAATTAKPVGATNASAPVTSASATISNNTASATAKSTANSTAKNTAAAAASATVKPGSSSNKKSNAPFIILGSIIVIAAGGVVALILNKRKINKTNY